MTGSLKQRYLLNKGCRGFRSLIEAIAAFGCFTTRYKKKDFKKAYIRLHWDIEMCWYFMFDIGMKLIKKRHIVMILWVTFWRLAYVILFTFAIET